MIEVALLPCIIRIFLSKVEYCSYLFTVSVGVQKELFITQRTAENTLFVVGHHKYRRLLLFLLSSSQEAHTLIREQSNPNSNLLLKFMTLKYTLETVKHSRVDAQLHHGLT